MKSWSPEALEARREYRRQYEREYRRNWRQKPENRSKAKEYERRYWERKALSGSVPIQTYNLGHFTAPYTKPREQPNTNVTGGMNP
ncbi:hypothetical protein J14TS5_03800 [Paenibacillus lautus]|uniref:hypothetical protein n=1 Tax=Paenibacillus lautus TaxID=1401 RepID=UPI001B05CD62|nr:hypothetical protein [Paenibacillus lautus]GIO95294.1 hypothetical protein J14TS5_03800 [Paenibacillus lautus]